MQIDANSREDYFSFAGSREAELRRMDAIIQKHAPALTLIDADLSEPSWAMAQLGSDKSALDDLM